MTRLSGSPHGAFAAWAVAALTATATVAALVFARGAWRPRIKPDTAPTIQRQSIPDTVYAPTVVRPDAVAPTAKLDASLHSCQPPFIIDTSGIKHWKLECL